MLDGVVTMPMSPAHADKPGFYSLLEYTTRRARVNKGINVFALNHIGKNVTPSALQTLQDTASLLQIDPWIWWSDKSVSSQKIFERLLVLTESGAIREERREISRCSCGKVEYLTQAKLFGRKKTLVRGQYAVCCNTAITSQSETALLTAPLPEIPIPRVFPVWAGKELEAMLKSLIGCQLLVSRKTVRLHRVSMSAGNSWELDNDLVWWLYLSWLNDMGIIARHVVSGASVVRQVAVLLTISKLAGLPMPLQVHCLPKVLFQPVHGIRNLTQAVDRFGQMRVRNALLWAALSERKEVILSGSLFPEMRDDLPIIESLNFRRNLLRR